MHLFAVFDGHGKFGQCVSGLLESELPKLLLEETILEIDPAQAIKNVLEEI